MLVSNRGLGTDLRVDCSSGNTIDCDSWSNILNTTCWGLCSAQTSANPVTETSMFSLFGLSTVTSMIMLGVGALAVFTFLGDTGPMRYGR